MRITILFGGTNKERLVSVASAQALHPALPEADLWFWDVDDTVHEVSSEALARACAAVRGAVQAGRSRRRRDRAGAGPGARPRTACWCSACMAAGRRMASCRRCAKCAGLPFTGSGSASSHLAFDKVAAKRFAAIAGVNAPAGVALEDIEAALAEHGKLIAKPARDGSSYGLIFVNSKQDLVAVRNAARTEEYLIEPFIAGVEATCGVLEQSDGSVIVAAADRDRSGGGRVRLHRQISGQIDPGNLPGRFAPEISAANHGAGAAGAPRAVVHAAIPAPISSSRRQGPIYLETNTLPGLTKASLYPKALKAQGIEFADFLQDQIALAAKRAQK